MKFCILFRYDGLYKVVEYFPETGKSGFNVWRYRLKRDDPTPAPWTKEGKERIAALGLELIRPEGYEIDSEKTKKSRKSDNLEGENGSNEEKPAKKRVKREIYRLEDKIIELIEQDVVNSKLWEDCRSVVGEGKPAFLKRVADR